MYSPLIENSINNQLLKTYKYHHDCLVYNETITKNYYTLIVNNNYYYLYDKVELTINSTISCFISKNSTISYLNIYSNPNEIFLIFLLIGILGLFVSGSLIKLCSSNSINKTRNTLFIKNPVNLDKPQTNNSINNKYNLYTNPDNKKENTTLLDNNMVSKFYDISLVIDK